MGYQCMVLMGVPTSAAKPLPTTPKTHTLWKRASKELPVRAIIVITESKGFYVGLIRKNRRSKLQKYANYKRHGRCICIRKQHGGLTYL